MPCALTHRHRYWFIDLRYLVRLGDRDDRNGLDGGRRAAQGEEARDDPGVPVERWVYSRCIIEGYSRRILAGMAFPYQDVVAVLQLLSAALGAYGRPEGIISDNGSVFTSDAYEGLLRAREVDVCHIEKGKPWQNLIEAQFKVERRLADAQVEQAGTLAEVQDRRSSWCSPSPDWSSGSSPRVWGSGRGTSTLAGHSRRPPSLGDFGPQSAASTGPTRYLMRP